MPLAAAVAIASLPAWSNTAPTPASLCTALTGKAIPTADGTATLTGGRLVAATNDEPEYCEVRGKMPPDLKFEVRLPTQWNQRLLYVGGGGFDGAIPSPLGYQFKQGYATAASDGGHTGTGTSDESWALDPEKLKDFAFRSVHKTMGVARALLQLRYGQSAVRAYFEGCSNGGREALIQAQRYPNDFDGIIARAPAWNFTDLLLAGNQIARQSFTSNANQLSTAKIATLSNAVLAACDHLDGSLDRVISNPFACRFDPTKLLCKGTANDGCLTAAQVTTVNTLYSVFRYDNEARTPYYIGWPPGGESDPFGWAAWVATPGSALPDLSTRFIRYFLQLGANYDPLRFVPENHLQIILNRAQLINAAATDYSAFRGRNGKLILWHGTNDWAISFNSTALYYNQIVAGAGGQASADQFVEFFPAPGVQHCAGGSGSDFVDLLTPLKNWVENGTPPSEQRLISLKLNYSNLTFSRPRPLCKFPTYPRYIDSGSIEDPNSYRCVAP
jgi:feruloyl esterase